MKIKKKSIPSFLQKALAEAKKKAVIKKFFSPYLLYKSKKQKGAKNKKLKGISAHCVPLSHKKDFVEIKISPAISAFFLSEISSIVPIKRKVIIMKNKTEVIAPKE